MQKVEEAIVPMRLRLSVPALLTFAADPGAVGVEVGDIQIARAIEGHSDPVRHSIGKERSDTNRRNLPDRVAAGVATKRLPALSKASPCRLLNPLPAKTEPAPSGVKI